MLCVWYFGELIKLRAYNVMCYVFQVLARIAGRRQLDLYTLADVMFLRSWDMFCYVTVDTLCFYDYRVNESMF